MSDGSDIDTEMPVLDMASVNADILAGARAFEKLLRHSDDDWQSWSLTIRGLRALRSLIFERTKTNNMQSQVYRDEMSRMLEQRKYSAYGHITKQARSSCYKLADRIEDIDLWYAALPTPDKLRWKHPDSIVKNCPRHLVDGGMRGHNKPKRALKKTFLNPEIERLRALLIKVIKRLVKYEPDARELLDQINPADPDDSVADVAAEDDEVEHAEAS
jgi:hypothetical protein